MIRRTLALSALALAALPPAAQAAPSSPAPVKGLSARPAGKLSATLAWDAAAGAARYRVLRHGKKVRDVKARTLKVRLTRAKARYQVAAVNGKGRLGHRSRTVIVVRGHSAPRAPVAAAATNVTSGAATLSWGRSKAVIALDSFGWASKRSGPIKVVTGHDPPAAPGTPRATSVTDTTLSLAWTASGLPAGSRLRGYRVMRDGVVVRQVPAAGADLTNLAPKSSHDWSVAAVDTRGYVSAPSRVTRVVQKDPPPSTGEAHAFLLASTDSSLQAFEKHYRQIGVVYPTFFDCNLQTGAIEGADNRLIVSYAQDRKVKVLPRFNCQSTTMLHTILTDPATRARWLDTIAALVDQYGYDGVNVDFEAIAASDRDALTSFIADLSRRLHAKGKLLSQSVSGKFRDVPNHPRSTAFDYQALSQYDDYVFVMAWGIHYATSAPGAQDDLSWVRQVADYVASMPNKQKFVMGTMLYGSDWPSGGGPGHRATALHYDEIQALAAQYGVQPVYDAGKDSWHLAYTDASGVPHDVWYSDAPVVARRVALARERGLGIGFWRIGQEDERIWTDPEVTR
ncbi:glycosyl hydrolase family 18 protein [Candidatus Solirubrobacter pratensis]|uniref:glycosyl hydrolase family 18 protein n=1 Tax=Candidatus Solirubrobacter pratensis TaxID=1298857 RepID=UPI000416243D|nr:glycosyl hydrolase family 18 protein [Candidatus Solirubrobacter pratensis]